MISVITINLNNKNGLIKTIKSIKSQKFVNLENIIIDGNSLDGSLDIINKYKKDIKYLIENDSGIYDAMNKGIKLSKFPYILFLNSGDKFIHDKVLSSYSSELKKVDYDLIFSNLYVLKDNRIIRKYNSSNFSLNNLKYGIMPAHPTCLIRKDLFHKIGNFDEKFLIAADYDWFARLLKNYNPKLKFLDEFTVHMESGGISNKNLLSKIKLNLEILQSCKKNYINTNILNIFLFKYFFKINEFFS